MCCVEKPIQECLEIIHLRFARYVIIKLSSGAIVPERRTI